LQLQGCRCLRI